jgi:hypothetical protein
MRLNSLSPAWFPAHRANFLIAGRMDGQELARLRGTIKPSPIAARTTPTEALI